jgi:hypothetical protein
MRFTQGTKGGTYTNNRSDTKFFLTTERHHMGTGIFTAWNDKWSMLHNNKIQQRKYELKEKNSREKSLKATRLLQHQNANKSFKLLRRTTRSIVNSFLP